VRRTCQCRRVAAAAALDITALIDHLVIGFKQDDPLDSPSEFSIAARSESPAPEHGK
jgi:hypothetical protein